MLVPFAFLLLSRIVEVVNAFARPAAVVCKPAAVVCSHPALSSSSFLQASCSLHYQLHRGRYDLTLRCLEMFYLCQVFVKLVDFVEFVDDGMAS